MLLACAYSWGIPVLLSCVTAIVQFANPSFMSVPGENDHSDDNDGDEDILINVIVMRTMFDSYDDGDISVYKMHALLLSSEN